MGLIMRKMDVASDVRDPREQHALDLMVEALTLLDYLGNAAVAAQLDHAISSLRDGREGSADG